ncbi:GPI transamidase component [Blastocladiella emersonii ATCC 22665]|nr:GPI transamidase component [Blastocladiella emersonii ATCC 22665]
MPLEFSRRTQRLVLASYILAFVLGVPKWWSLTSVPRARLPLRELADVHDAKSIPVTLQFQWLAQCPGASAAGPAFDVSGLNALAQAEFGDASDGHRVLVLESHSAWQIDYQVTVSDASSAAAAASGSAIQVCAVAPDTELAARSVHVDAAGLVKVAAVTVEDAAKSLAAYAQHLASLMARPGQSMHFSQQYEVLLSLMVQNPERTPVRAWDVSAPAAAVLRPVLTEILGDAARFKLVSQVEYYAQPGSGVTLPSPPPLLPIHMRVELDAATGEWVEQAAAPQPPQPVAIPVAQLPHFVNPDWSLAAVTPNHSVVHLVTYVPDPQTPMTVLGPSGDASRSNDFVVPRWGGVAVRNLAPGSPKVDAAALAPVWLAHLREVFGVVPLAGTTAKVGPRKAQPTTITFAANTRAALTAAERLVYHQSQVAVHVAETVETLAALVRLTDQQANLPVSRSLARRVAAALERVALVRSGAGAARDRFAAAWQARRDAEAAFFDPEMVGLAYFPAEHTYAVYMPLFVPVLTTVVMMAAKEVRLWRAGK